MAIELISRATISKDITEHVAWEAWPLAQARVLVERYTFQLEHASSPRMILRLQRLLDAAKASELANAVYLESSVVSYVAKGGTKESFVASEAYVSTVAGFEPSQKAAYDAVIDEFFGEAD